MNKIESLMVNIFGNEFNRFDMCLNGPSKIFGPYYIEIYKLPYPYMIPVGPLPLEFSKYKCPQMSWMPSTLIVLIIDCLQSHNNMFV